jgi:phage-related protein
MARGYLTFGGVDSRDYGVYISGTGVYNAPAREYTFTAVPGRSGDLILDGKRYSNIVITYPAFIYSSFAANVAGWRNALLTADGYVRLEDSYHPDEYRLAVYAGPFDVETAPLLVGGSFDLAFNCKPQRWLKSGEIQITYTASGTITNPEHTDARPLLKITGTGTCTVGSTVITITEANGPTYIDSDLMEIYDSSFNNRGSYVTMTDNLFPTLAAGENGIQIGDMTAIEVTPRWWRL